MKCQGTVISVDGTKARVKVTTASECMGCSSKSHCHSGITVSHEITVINECDAKVSDHVIFEADTGKVIATAALMWILPLISMIISSGQLPAFSHQLPTDQIPGRNIIVTG